MKEFDSEKLKKDLIEMETFKVDIGDEGKILQDDLKNFFINGEGDKKDLIFRLELYFYAFKLFCRKEAVIDRNQFTIFLHKWEGSHNYFIDFPEVIDEIQKQLSKFYDIKLVYVCGMDLYLKCGYYLGKNVPSAG